MKGASLDLIPEMVAALGYAHTDQTATSPYTVARRIAGGRFAEHRVNVKIPAAMPQLSTDVFDGQRSETYDRGEAKMLIPVGG